MKEEFFLLELANQIRIARKRSGKSQMEVLDDTGINVVRIEKGAPSIQLFTYFRLYKYLDISPVEIIKQIDINLARIYSGVIVQNGKV